jgi:hypothetical protein
VRGVDGAAETGAAAGEVPRDAAARAHEGRTGPLGENARRSGPGGRDRRRWCAATEPLGRHRAPGAGRGGAGSDGDFFALLQTTRGMRPDDGSWWAQAQPAAPVTERLAALQRVIAGAPSAPHPTPHPAPRALAAARRVVRDHFRHADCEARLAALEAARQKPARGGGLPAGFPVEMRWLRYGRPF